MLFQSVLMLASGAVTVLAREILTELSGSCSANFKICAPAGTKTDSLGPIGPDWGDLYTDIVNLVSNYGISQPAVDLIDTNGPVRRAEGVFCCANIADCLLVPVFDIAMCWDRFTTNVYFPDGTYGTVVTGDFNTTNGVSVNLVYGDYTMKNGTTGNIYSASASASASVSLPPDTSTMPMPSPWTSSGEGSAIPVTGLGTTASLSIVTTTIPATTTPPSTGSSITIIATMTGCNHCPAYNTTIPGPTQPGGTRPAITSTISTGIITPTIVGNIGTSLDPYITYILVISSIAIIATQFLI